MNTIREIQKINEQELERGIAGTPASWHAKYARSPWVYVGNLDFSLSEGDVLCVLSQYGEMEDLHLIRDDDTGQSKGFGFGKYEDARSCILAVDNLSGFLLRGRPLRVDHVENYRLPKHLMEKKDATEEGEDQPQREEGRSNNGSVADASSQGRVLPGHAYQGQELANQYSMQQGMDLFAPDPPVRPTTTQGEAQRHHRRPDDDDEEEEERDRGDEKRRRKEERRKHREEKEQRRRDRERRRAEREERRREKRAHRLSERDQDSDTASSLDDHDERPTRKRSQHDGR